MTSISCAEFGDVQKIALIHTVCWQEVYAFMPKKVHQNRDLNHRVQQWQEWFQSKTDKDEIFTVKTNGQIVGFAAVKPNRETCVEALGELHACYLMPEFRGTTLGPMAMRAMADFLFQTNQWPASIWAFRQSPYRRIYPMLGAKAVIFRDRVIAGVSIPEIGYKVSNYELFTHRLDQMCASAARRQRVLLQTRRHPLSRSG